MSVSAMVADPDSGFNRRRVREGTQIYRPPAARSSRSNEVLSKPYENNSFYQEQLIQQQHHYLEALKEYHNLHHDRYSNTCSNPVQTNIKESDKYKSKRPDQLFYVPKGRRLPDDKTDCSTPTPYDELSRPCSPANSVCSVVSEFSGRNRYNKNGRHNRPSLDSEDKVHYKPPMSLSRESPSTERGRNKSTLFASETLQLIERCINHDPNKPLNSSPSWENSSNKYSGINKTNDYNSKNSHQSKDNHPVHSKENMIHPLEFNQRSRRGKRNRKRGSKSREQSTESRGSYSRRSSISTENLEKTHYNSNESSFERHNFNYDRMNSRNSSRASSRNPSIERPVETKSGYEWRFKSYSNPCSPVKHTSPSLDETYRRHSLGKPPMGKSLPVHNTQSNEDKSFSYSSSKEVDTSVERSLEKSSCINDKLDNSQSQQILDELSEFKSKDNDKVEICSESVLNSSENLGSLNDSDSVPKSLDVDDKLTLKPVCTQSDETVSPSTHNPVCTMNEISRSSSPSNDTEERNQDEVSIIQITNDTAKPEEDEENQVIDSSTEDSHFVRSEDLETLTKEEVDTKFENINSSSEELNPKKFSFNWADEMDQATEEDSWDSLYDDSGNCLNGLVKQELEDNIGKLKLEKPTHDYLEFKPQAPQIADDDYGNIIEIYDFPATFQTQDLLTVFQEYKGLELKWVDDTHALGIFNTQLLASDGLNLNHPFVKTRPLSKAIEASKSKAIRLAERLPFKPRPETSVALARRLVSGALGLRVRVSKEQRDAERQKLKNAKEKKKLIAKQKEDAWEGTISNNA